MPNQMRKDVLLKEHSVAAWTAGELTRFDLADHEFRLAAWALHARWPID
jgi:hypothetical protein